jgi:hypothetical protein
MHSRKPPPGGRAGVQTNPELPHACPGHPWQNRPSVIQLAGASFGTGSWDGAQPVSTNVSASIVSDCAHGVPAQSCPAGMESLVVQPPSHPAGGSNGVAGVLESAVAQVAA